MYFRKKCIWKRIRPPNKLILNKHEVLTGASLPLFHKGVCGSPRWYENLWLNSIKIDPCPFGSYFALCIFLHWYLQLLAQCVLVFQKKKLAKIAVSMFRCCAVSWFSTAPIEPYLLMGEVGGSTVFSLSFSSAGIRDNSWMVFFKTTYIVLVNLQEVAGGKNRLLLLLEAVNFTGYGLIRRTLGATNWQHQNRKQEPKPRSMMTGNVASVCPFTVHKGLPVA